MTNERALVDDFIIEPATEADWEALHRAASDAFLTEYSEQMADASRSALEIDRTLVARRDAEIVGTASLQTRRLAVPGGVVPAAHVTDVTVAAASRRRGILTGFMRRQFDDARAAGEPIAVLWATEGRIYQRFGYGLGATRLSLAIDTTEVRLQAPAPGGRLREGTPASLRDELVALFDRAYPGRPGWSERAPRHWDFRLADLKEWRQGDTPMRAVVHYDDAGQADGYALWRANRRWSEGGPDGHVRVVEQVGITPEGYTAIWAFLLSIDLTRTVDVWLAAVDEPLLYAVSDPRRLGARLGDALWLRVLDVPAALTARRYATDVDVVVEVTDALLSSNAGRWRLRGGPDGATCASTVDEPELSCDVRALGAVYLGGVSLRTLAATGQVGEHTPGALARADAALRWPIAPSSVEIF